MARPKSIFSPPEPGEVFFTSADRSRAIRRAVAEDQARELAPRLYTTNMADDPSAVIKRNIWPVVQGYFPGALVADRTAFEGRPSTDGSVFLVAGTRRTIELPGLTLRARPGPGPVTDSSLRYADHPFMGGLWLSSFPRRLLENVKPSRRGVPRTLSRAELEREIERLLTSVGEEQVNQWRDQARELAPLLGAEQDFAELDRLIGSMLGTEDAPLVSPLAQARRSGLPYDEQRLPLFEALRAELHRFHPQDRPLPNLEITEALAFFEAYFSNYIEGTEFTVEEAEAIVFEGRIPSERPQDAHDIVGTFRLTADPVARARVPSSCDELVEILTDRHKVMLAQRPDANPGQLKQQPNLVGARTFVEPQLVRGTLARGFEYYEALAPGFPRATFIMFLIAEVHPFVDGNGRIARLLMNAELAAVDQQRIVVPTSRRDDYLTGLRALSSNTRADALVKIMDRLQVSSAEIDWSSRQTARAGLDVQRAFTGPDDDIRQSALLPRFG